MAKRINIVRGSAAGTAEISPIDYLGSDFRAYVSACSGSRFDGGKRCQVAQIGDLARIAAALEKAGFQVVADSDAVDATDGFQLVYFGHNVSSTSAVGIRVLAGGRCPAKSKRRFSPIAAAILSLC